MFYLSALNGRIEISTIRIRVNLNITTISNVSRVIYADFLFKNKFKEFDLKVRVCLVGVIDYLFCFFIVTGEYFYICTMLLKHHT